MLSEKDIDYMKEAKDEMYELRKRPIKLIYKREERDPITGVIIGESKDSIDAKAVITEISSALPDKTIEGGVMYDEPDIKIDIKYYEVAGMVDGLVNAEYLGRDYEITAIDRKGIGERDRFEILGRAIV